MLDARMALHDPQHLIAVARDERRPDAVDRREVVDPARARGRDRLQGAVVGHRVGGLAGGRIQAPGPQRLEQALVSGRELGGRGLGAPARARSADFDRLGGGQPLERVADVAAPALGIGDPSVAEVVEQAAAAAARGEAEGLDRAVGAPAAVLRDAAGRPGPAGVELALEADARAAPRGPGRSCRRLPARRSRAGSAPRLGGDSRSAATHRSRPYGAGLPRRRRPSARPRCVAG